MSDLIIEGAKVLHDGLYVKKDGEFFKYKPNGGTVRSYHITDRPKGEWVEVDYFKSDYAKWLEDRIIDICPTHICEDYMDTQQGNDWCQGNCEYSSIQKECLRRIYLDTVLGGENE